MSYEIAGVSHSVRGQTKKKELKQCYNHLDTALAVGKTSYENSFTDMDTTGVIDVFYKALPRVI